jgi:hypothetical protein
MSLASAAAALAWLAIASIATPASAQPDPSKVLRVAFPAAETGFDPQAAGDEYSNSVNRVIFDTLYRYDYLARPYKLVPNTAAGMPEFSADGRTWTIRVRPGTHFADDPVFKGQRRELTPPIAYAMKRDPRCARIRCRCSTAAVGARPSRRPRKRAFRLRRAIEGLQAVDRYTPVQAQFRRLRLLPPDDRRHLGASRKRGGVRRDGAGWDGEPRGNRALRLRTGGARGSC